MDARVFRAGVFGAVAMFLWTFVAHMLLPFGEAGIKQIHNEKPLLEQMKITLPEPGLYMFPEMLAGETQEQYQTKIATSPSGLMAYFPRREFNFGVSLAVEFGTQLVQSLALAWLLSATRLETFGKRVLLCAVVGLAVAVGTNVSYWNWYGFTVTYTLAFMFTQWMAYICAGLASAAQFSARHFHKVEA